MKEFMENQDIVQKLCDLPREAGEALSTSKFREGPFDHIAALEYGCYLGMIEGLQLGLTADKERLLKILKFAHFKLSQALDNYHDGEPQ